MAPSSAKKTPETKSKDDEKGRPSLTSCPQDITAVVVGKEPDQKTFNVHKAFLTHYSPYFDKALNGGFAEAVSGQVVLDHTKPEVFGLFVEWVYYQTVSETPCTDASLSNSDRSLQHQPTWETLFKLWELADYLQVPQLQNLMVDKIIACKELYNIIPAYLFTWIWSTFPSGNVLRKLSVDMLCWAKWNGEFFTTNGTYFPYDLLLELAAANAARHYNKISDSPLSKPSNYYVGLSEGEKD